MAFSSDLLAAPRWNKFCQEMPEALCSQGVTATRLCFWGTLFKKCGIFYCVGRTTEATTLFVFTFFFGPSSLCSITACVRSWGCEEECFMAKNLLGTSVLGELYMSPREHLNPVSCNAECISAIESQVCFGLDFGCRKNCRFLT